MAASKAKEAAKWVKVTQVKSSIGYRLRQKRTIEALGLKRIGHAVVQHDGPVLRGMVRRVHHLVRLEQVNKQ